MGSTGDPVDERILCDLVWGEVFSLPGLLLTRYPSPPWTRYVRQKLVSECCATVSGEDDLTPIRSLNRVLP